MGLRGVRRAHAARLAEKELLREKATALLGHADPGVRGRAAELLAAAADDGDEAKQAVAMLLLPLLKDTHPATRSHAVLALAWLGHPGAVHELMPLIADRTKDRYVLSGFKHLSGDPGEIEHGGEGTVGQTVLFALQRLAVHTDEKLAYRLRRDGSAEDRASAEAQAKAWYDKMKAKLPRLPASAKKDAGEAKH